MDDAVGQLRDLPFRALGFAHADTHRHVRTGFPEVIYGEGKTPKQIAKILTELHQADVPVMATRVEPDAAAKVLAEVPSAVYHDVARAIVLGDLPEPTKGRGRIVILSAGTSDIPVAEEAALTCQFDGNDIEKIYDVGVAGLHRLLAHRRTVEAAEVVIAVAGMDGVLPTVTAGLFNRPVIAVPTSIGYGANLGGWHP